jgi:hypothetical protein
MLVASSLDGLKHFPRLLVPKCAVEFKQYFPELIEHLVICYQAITMGRGWAKLL